MKHLLLNLVLIFLPVLVYAQGLENVIVERYYISNAKDATAAAGGTLAVGSVTYRIYVDMAPGWKLRTVFAKRDYGQDLRIATTTTFFNNTFAGQKIANEIYNSDLDQNTMMLDSWISLGGASEGNLGVLKADDTDGAIYNQGAGGFLQNNDPLAGTPISIKDGMISGTPSLVSQNGLDDELMVFDAVNAGPEFYSEDGLWYNTSGASGPTSDNRVLIAQVTTDGVMTFNLNFSMVRTSDNKKEVYAHTYPANENEILCEKCNFNGVITGMRDIQLNDKEPELRLFPIPASNSLNIEIKNGFQDGIYSYSVFNMIGVEILQCDDIEPTGNYIRNIDISSLLRGAYIITVKSGNGFRSTKLFTKTK